MSRWIMALVVALLVGCTSTPPAQTWPGNELAGGLEGAGPYRVQRGDTIGVRFPAYPQWNASLLVEPDGNASVPLLGAVRFEGRPLREIESELHELLIERVRSPVVELVVEQLHLRAVFVGGEVANPGAVELSGPRMTLLEALFSRGGPIEDSAALGTVVLSRVVDGRRNAWTIDAHGLFDSGTDPVLLLPGDVLLVPGTRIVNANRFVDQYITKMIPGSNLLAGLILAGS